MDRRRRIARILIVGSALAVLAAAIEVLARFDPAGPASTRAATAVWCSILLALAAGAPAAVDELADGGGGSMRWPILTAFVAFDLVAGLVLWRWVVGGDAFGSPLVVVVAATVVIAFAVSARGAAAARRTPPRVLGGVP